MEVGSALSWMSSYSQRTLTYLIADNYRPPQHDRRYNHFPGGLGAQPTYEGRRLGPRLRQPSADHILSPSFHRIPQPSVEIPNHLSNHVSPMPRRPYERFLPLQNADNEPGPEADPHPTPRQ